MPHGDMVQGMIYCKMMYRADLNTCIVNRSLFVKCALTVGGIVISCSKHTFYVWNEGRAEHAF